MTSQEPEKKLCSVCNKFWGTAQTNWMCSQCFKLSNVKLPQTKIEVKKEEPKPQPVVKQADRSKCHKCNKKVGLLGNDCQCGYVFCNLHRMAEEHDCEFNYKTSGKNQISKQNEKLVARKLSEI